jgi:hypothetical protein
MPKKRTLEEYRDRVDRMGFSSVAALDKIKELTLRQMLGAEIPDWMQPASPAPQQAAPAPVERAAPRVPRFSSVAPDPEYPALNFPCKPPPPVTLAERGMVLRALRARNRAVSKSLLLGCMRSVDRERSWNVEWLEQVLKALCAEASVTFVDNLYQAQL